MLDITGEHIKELNDSDLRTLIGRLCECELSSKGQAISSVTMGGHQNAKDGGIDVMVNVHEILEKGDFIPNRVTGFQVKRTDMLPGKIFKEMCPKGELKKSIIDIAKINGAYVIVSSQASTSDSSLILRRGAMHQAISSAGKDLTIVLDFFDCERVASWVRSYPPMILWVREKISKPIQGWKPYDNWANCPKGITEKYLFDKDIRVYLNSNSDSTGMSGLMGIQAMRNDLDRPNTCIRLVGLSGVGKTRFVQALFDSRIGKKALDTRKVFYTDMSLNPYPSPIEFAEELVAIGKNSILIIDNCHPKLHRELALICSKYNNKINLLTIEYDIKEDQTENTQVYKLEPASNNLIELIIKNRFNFLDEKTVTQISEFSGGNSRIAMALCNTFNRGEIATRLKDNQLFERLFYQNNPFDTELMKIAEVCSLYITS